MRDRQPVYISYGTARLWKKAADISFGMPRPPRAAAPDAPASSYGVVRARVTTAIPAGTWTSPSSSGRAQIRHMDEAGAWVDAGDPVEVWNDHPLCPGATSVAVNTVVKLGWISGMWWLM